MAIFMTRCSLLLFSALLVSPNIISTRPSCGAESDPTDGFIPVPLTEYNFKLQKPYDTPLEDRYSFINGTRRLWVYADDKPHNPNSRTQPRTEVRIHGLDYFSGVWQFEGHGFVPNGTSGATVAQIHGAAHGATTIILRIYNDNNGEMRYYSRDRVDGGDLYDKWFRLNIIHDVDGGTVSVFIDGVKKFQVRDKGPPGADGFYFKCGVYAAPSSISYYMESRPQSGSPNSTMVWDSQFCGQILGLSYCDYSPSEIIKD
ncbi:hypothetical protein FNV43_RR10674 [Rhamnella rubrinervis]|uniref:Alginate lyase 2 domain-containing protein n=1 Tax=Rhamnella rubrinervis TaxID=2594499 RepID=A0A8K0H4U0_9ROSA|nr:hypothetical protein FNV43_RR10674 [Rhamnella rubrinervis]